MLWDRAPRSSQLSIDLERVPHRARGHCPLIYLMFAGYALGLTLIGVATL
jgi:hypothetical protein